MAKRVKSPEPATDGTGATAAGAVRPQWNTDAAATMEQTKRKTLFANLESGLNIIRVLPRFDGARALFVQAKLHYQITREDGEGTFAPGCLAYYREEPCYICRFIEWMQRNMPDEEEDTIRRMVAQDKLTAQVLVQDQTSKRWTGPFLMGIPGGVATSMSTWLSVSQNTGTPMFCDPDNGMAVAIVKSGKGLATRYEASLVQRVEKLDDIMPGWEAKVIRDIETKQEVKVLSVEEQKKALYRTLPHLPWSDIHRAIG